MAKTKSHRNRISYVSDISGQNFTAQTDIESCFTSFFQDLRSPKCRWSFPNLIRSLSPDHIFVSEKDKAFLTKHVTYSGILATIKSMAKDKSPGPDGLNVKFYLFFWDIIKDPLYKAISHFFSTAQLPKTWGRGGGGRNFPCPYSKI